MHRARTRWWRSRKFRLNVDVHCVVRGLQYIVRVQVWSGRSGKNPGRERRRRRHGRFGRSIRRPSTIATSDAMSKTWSTATKTVPAASEPAQITGVAVVAAKSTNTMATATALSASTAATNKVREEGQETTRHPLTFSFLSFWLFFPATVAGVICLCVLWAETSVDNV
ncbi:uncharacterized protein LOC125553934 [Triticum urartu]|uniref:uncharacterized protein LOC125553929 n=1 Tax=Triticum urartu TaxID=4572 RepID=UPI0020440011|nr:uncharacterized protein LOC125553929 [Triticum urartu]XP_048573542.1 uncharacterized protein LOC125553934 [Triticum urartu]